MMSTAVVKTPTPARATLYQRRTVAAGTNMSGTTAACVREKKSTKSLSNILGDSGLSFSICVLSLHVCGNTRTIGTVLDDCKRRRGPPCVGASRWREQPRYQTPTGVRDRAVRLDGQCEE